MEAAETKFARLLIITSPEIVIAQTIVQRVRKVNAEIQVVARAPGIEFLEEFKKLNISDVVIPEFEAGLEMARKALVHLHIPAAKDHSKRKFCKNCGGHVMTEHPSSNLVDIAALKKLQSMQSKQIRMVDFQVV